MNKDNLICAFKEHNIACDESQLHLLENIMSETLHANKSFNLTAIKEEDKFRELMVFDSALPLKEISPTGKKCIDIGTGAGFPGLVLSILSNNHFDLLDSTKKKIDHLNILANKYSLDVAGINYRSEEYSRIHREEYDYAFARAVSELHVLIEIIVPLLKVGGTLVTYKGPKYLEELKRSKKIMKVLGVELVKIQKETLPESQEERFVLYFIKRKESLNKYPREYNLIVRN